MKLAERVSAELDAERPEVIEAGRLRGLKWAAEDGDLETITILKNRSESQSEWFDAEEILLAAGIRDDFDDGDHLDILWGDFVDGFCDGAAAALEQALEQVRRSQ